jgi:hypothetical protein
MFGHIKTPGERRLDPAIQNCDELKGFLKNRDKSTGV